MNAMKRRWFAGIAGLLVGSSALAADLVKVDDSTFDCLTNMTPVRGFFVANVLGNLEGTLKAARAPDGAVYPVGSVVQLVPTEVMVKQPAGTNPATKDWEFFELKVSAQGSKIDKRGFTEVINQFGGNCFGCHSAAKPQWDLICETGHGCAPLPITREQIEQVQKADPRCPVPAKAAVVPVSAAERPKP